MDTITVEVTADDIDVGRPLSCQLCPIARAIDRRLKGALSSVYGATVTIRKTSGLFVGRIELPEEAQRFIRQFDSFESRGCEPFSFELPCESFKEFVA